MPDNPPIQKGDKQGNCNQWDVFAENTAEKEKEGKSVDESAGTDVPSRFAYNKGKQSRTKPDQDKNLAGYLSVKIKKTLGKEE